MSLARLQHEVEELRRRIEELKMKLTAEMKVRYYLYTVYSIMMPYVKRCVQFDFKENQRPHYLRL